jgi:hypothetical protein
MRLVITIPVEEAETTEETIQEAKNFLQGLFGGNPGGTGSYGDAFLSGVEVTLLREGDRSGANLLLPKLNGRVGEHYQNKKAKIEDVEFNHKGDS